MPERTIHSSISGSDQMLRKLIQVFLLLAFWSGLVFVGVQTWRFPTTQTTENRILAAKPQLPGSWHGIPDYIHSLDAWWTDSMAFRQLFIRYFNLMRMNVGISPQKDVLIGKDGWLFDGGTQLEDFRNSKLFTAAEIKAWREYLLFRHIDAKKHGAKFIFVIIPNKESVYAEYMPDNITKLGKISRIDQIVESVKEDGVAVLDLRKILEEGKKHNLRIYHQNDIHWNLIGANYGQYGISQALAPDFPKLKPELHPLDDFEFVDGNAVNKAGIVYYGGLILWMGLADMKRENEPVFKAVRPGCAEPAELDLTPWQNLTEKQKAQNFKATACKTGNYRAVVFRDSFTELMMPYLSETYQYIAYLWLPRPVPMNAWSHFLATAHPDIVIDESVERFLKIIPRAGIDYPSQEIITQAATPARVVTSPKTTGGPSIPWDSLDANQKSVLSVIETVWPAIPIEKQKIFLAAADKWNKTVPEDQKKIMAELKAYRDGNK
jgi:alginate O-acetyltransferase complex protein AlgJ